MASSTLRRHSLMQEGTAKDPDLNFDVNDFKPSKHNKTGLTFKTKKILEKDPGDRTRAELHALMNLVEQMKSFKQFSLMVKLEFPKLLVYEFVDPGHVILKQGDVGKYFYFVVSGSVMVEIETTNAVTGETSSRVVAELKAGTTFGENPNRTATVISRGCCELLRVDREEFQELLAKSADTRTACRLQALHSIPALSQWKEDEIEALNQHCKTLDFPRNDVIYNESLKSPDFVYFITSGEIKVVREMFIKVTVMSLGHTKYQLVKDFDENAKEPEVSTDNAKPTYLKDEEIPYFFPEERDVKFREYRRKIAPRLKTTPMSSVVQRRLWTVCTLRAGLYYGLGENLDYTKSHLVAKERVEVIKIPRSQFKLRGRSEDLDQLRENLNEVLPSDEEVFEAFQEDRKWEEYKQEVVQEVMDKRRPRSTTTALDVPRAVVENCHSMYTALSRSLF